MAQSDDGRNRRRIERGLIDLDPGAVEAGVFPFKLDGLPAIAAISDSGYGEVAVRVAVMPTECGVELVRYFGCGFRCGDCCASGWLERRPGGAVLQTPSFRCRRWLLPLIAAAEVGPTDYRDCRRLM